MKRDDDEDSYSLAGYSTALLLLALLSRTPEMQCKVYLCRAFEYVVVASERYVCGYSPATERAASAAPVDVSGFSNIDSLCMFEICADWCRGTF